MRLNGALRPHGAPYIGRSIGAKNYRDKRPQQQKPINKYKFNSHNNTVTASDQSSTSSNNNNNRNNITTLSAVKAAAQAAANNLKRTPGYYPLTDVFESDVFIKATCKRSGIPTSPSQSASSPTPPEPVASEMVPLSGRASGGGGGDREETAMTGCGSGEVKTPSMEKNGVKSESRHRRRLMRVPQSLVAGLSSYSMLVLCLVCVLTLLPSYVICDDDNGFFVNSFSMGLETTTPEFDYASRGKKKFGDKCENTLECGFPRSICDPKKKSCQCVEDYPVTNHIDKCGKEAAVNESCFFNEQCESSNFQTECRDSRCVCRFEMTPFVGKDGIECRAGNKDKRGPETYIDPAMIGVLVGMALMFVIICVVLRLFSQARWRENRTIFNTPNPRLMNVSLLRDSKLLHGQERRGSRMSVRAPSRQPSMASLRPHSPNPSLGKTGSRSGSGSNASATSVRSTRSNSVAPGAVNHDRKSSAPFHHHQQPQQQPLITNITSNPVAESVTVEIIEPEK